MSNRIFAAALAAVLGVGGMLAPVEAPARGGGFVAGRMGFGPGLGHGGFHPFVGRPFVQPRPAPLPAAIDHGIRVGSNAFAPRFGARRFFGHGLPADGIGIYYGDYDDEIADSSAYQEPVYLPAGGNFAPGPQYGYQIAAERGVCRSRTRTVPSETGGQRKVTITSC